MMKKLFLQITTNAVAIYIASQIVSGFIVLEDDFITFLTLGFVFGLINFFIKPILKLISAPIILLTFGLFTIVINIAMLFLLDYLTETLVIEGFVASFWAMIVISAVNLFIGSFSKK